MLIRIISRSSKMISRLNHLFFYHGVGEINSPLLHSSQFHIFSETQFFHSLEENRKPFTAKSAAQLSITHSDGIPRTAKTEAQAALFDYLHCTRGLSFLDAEHISKNSAFFLGNLIAKFEKEQDVKRALTKYFRYNPINEFEPFFESLGLSQQEFASLLPRGLIFLDDDHLLLDNYHVLSDYGVPRSKIGRMYMEVSEIFRYEFGVLGIKLRAYENLGLSRSTAIKIVTRSPILLVGELNNAFVRVLEKLKDLGFESNWIGGYISRKNKYNWDRILDTLCFLEEVGFSDEEMGDLLRKETSLLLEGSGKQVYLVVGALLKLGLEMVEIYDLVLKNQQILSPKCGMNFWKALHFLFEIGMELENTAKILSSHMELLGSHSIKGSKTVLKKFNGDKHTLRETIKGDPSAFFNFVFKLNNFNPEYIAARNPNNFVEKTKFLLRIGYVENSEEMVKALKRFRGRGDQLQERFDCLVEAGLDFNEVSRMVKKAPTILNQTKYILEKKIDCLEKYLGYPVESIVSFPSYLCYDTKRISERFHMYSWLREKGATKPLISVSTLLASSDVRFMKYFVNVHPEGPEVWESFKKLLPSS